MTAILWTALIFGQSEFTGKVTHVHDGDTAHVTKADGTVVKVRLLICDAPEIDQPAGVASRDFCKSLCLDKDVTVKSPGLDEYGRTLGEVFVGSTSVNKEMIKHGHAWWFWHYDADEANGVLEVAAKKGRLGLFAAETPIYPRNWRRGARIHGTGETTPSPASPSDSGEGDDSGVVSSVFIMALLPDPAGIDANNETVILGNSSNVPASIDLWRLADDDGGEMPLSGTVPAGGAYTVRLTSSLQLGNGGDAVSLRNSAGETVQTVEYSSTARGQFIVRSP